MEEYISIKDAAIKANVHENTIYRLVRKLDKEGKEDLVKREGKKVFVKESYIYKMYSLDEGELTLKTINKKLDTLMYLFNTLLESITNKKNGKG